jgi:hypothetical protein
MDIKPSPAANGSDDCEHPLNLCGHIDRLCAQGFHGEVIESLDLGRRDERKQGGLKRTHSDPSHEPNGLGSQVSAATIDVRAH